MISVCMLGGAGGSSVGVARYYLTPDQACGLGYYTERAQVPGRWQGMGAEALSLAGSLGPEGAARLVQLLNAEDSDGQLLVRPVWRSDPAGRLPARPLLARLHQEAVARGVPLDELLMDPSNRATLLGLLRRTGASRVQTLGDNLEEALASGLARGNSRSSGVHVDAAVAGRLANAAGLDPVEVFRGTDGSDLFTPALVKAGSRIDVRRVGIDITVSAPKSVSVLQGLADPDTSALIEVCHDRAVQQALGYLERQAGHGFRGHHGDGQVMERVGTDGLIAAGFTHHTSRAGDPQLHTHLVVPNLLHGADGKWSAVDSRAVFRHAKTAGFLYHASLRHELAKELGVAWTNPVKGQAEILGVPREVLREFSERRRQIESALSRTGGKSRAAAQAACLATRQRKQHTSLDVLRENWQHRTLQLGTSTAALMRASGMTTTRWPFSRSVRRKAAPPLQLSPDQITDVAALVLGPDGVTAKTTGFDRRDLLQALAVTVPLEHTGNAIDLERLADYLLSDPSAVPVEAGAENEHRWTTLELLATEQRTLTVAASTGHSPTPNSESVEALLHARPWLAEEQRQAIRTLAGDARLVGVLVGPAGSGKTAVLTAIKDLANAAGNPVLGCSLAALTARRLEQGSAIPSSSLAKLLSRLNNNQNSLAPGTLVVVDEAGMVGTRQLARLLEHVEQAQGRILLVGDPAQLPEIDAGGMFRHLSQPDQRPAVLRGNQRQQHSWEVSALDRLRTGHHPAALASYAQHGRLTRTDSRDELHTLIAADYLAETADATSPEAMRETVVLAAQHLDVDTLNEEIRRILQDHDRLGPDAITLELPGGDVGFATGDQVIVTRPCRDVNGRQVLNGTRGHLIDAGRNGLRVQPDDGSAFTLSPEASVAALRHGYALTIHKAQGVTVTTALVVSDGLTGNAAYTALSRGRVRNQLYLHIDDPQTGVANWPGAFERLCEQLSRPQGDALASHQVLPPASGLARTPVYEPPQPHTSSHGRSIGV